MAARLVGEVNERMAAAAVRLHAPFSASGVARHLGVGAGGAGVREQGASARDVTAPGTHARERSLDGRERGAGAAESRRASV